MRALILACVTAGLMLACGSGSNDGGSGRNSPAQANLTITTTGNGLVRGSGSDCRGSCRAQMSVSSPVHLVAIPDAGAFFVGWAGACSGNGACDLTLDVDREVSATFGNVPPSRGKNELVMVVQGKGRVTSAPAGIDCDSATCNGHFDAGTSVTLTATASTGFTFSGWGNDCSGAGACTVTLSKNATIFANFVAQPPLPSAQVHLTASVTGPGTVTGGGLNCGETASTCDVMVGGGSTVTLMASAAGATRFMGWGGACSGTSNTCQLTLQSDTSVTAAFQSQVLVLAPDDTTNGAVIALNSTQVFWPRLVNGVQEIWSVPKNGGKPVHVADGRPNSMVADDAFLYWTDDLNVYSTPAGGGDVALLAGGGVIGKLALDENGTLYWTVGSDPSRTDFSGGAVHRMQNRKDEVIVRNAAPSNQGLAVDGAHVYFTAHDGQGSSIKRAPRSGGAVETLFSCGQDCIPAEMKVDAQFLYYRVWNGACDFRSGRVEAVRKSDFARHLVSNNASGFCDELSGIDANGSIVYWNSNGGQAPSGIYRANADGTGQAAVDSGGATNWIGVRVDDAAVYYWHNGAIIRRLK